MAYVKYLGEDTEFFKSGETIKATIVNYGREALYKDKQGNTLVRFRNFEIDYDKSIGSNPGNTEHINTNINGERY